MYVSQPISQNKTGIFQLSGPGTPRDNLNVPFPDAQSGKRSQYDVSPTVGHGWLNVRRTPGPLCAGAHLHYREHAAIDVVHQRPHLRPGKLDSSCGRRAQLHL